MTFVLMGILGLTLFFKIIIGAIYSIKNRCLQKINLNSEVRVNYESTVDMYFSQVKKSIHL